MLAYNNSSTGTSWQNDAAGTFDFGLKSKAAVMGNSKSQFDLNHD